MTTKIKYEMRTELLNEFEDRIILIVRKDDTHDIVKMIREVLS